MAFADIQVPRPIWLDRRIKASTLLRLDIHQKLISE
jgi:hypothetical protein